MSPSADSDKPVEDLDVGLGADFQTGQVIFNHLVNQLCHAGAVVVVQDEVNGCLDGGQRVGDGGGAAAQPEKSVIVFRVADSHRFLRCEPHLG